MTELLLLLLPVAAVTGWLAARRSMRQSHASTPQPLAPDYFRGLNYILNEQPDKAIEVFIKMVEVDSDTVETHLALGSLFRRRGETDRAIRVHQNIIARPTLSHTQRSQALFELGLDYMRAGLLDRAESLFLELLDIGEHIPQALRQLREIYEQSKDWDKAIDIARRLEDAESTRLNDVIAQYYCELAEAVVHENDLSSARQWLGKALSTDSNCTRASILLGEVEMSCGDYRAAIHAFKRVEQQDPTYITEIIEPLRECYDHLGELDEMERYLRRLLDRHGGITPVLMLSDFVEARDGHERATQFMIQQLRVRPSVRGLDRLIEFNLAHTEGQPRENLLILKDIANKLLEDRPVYKCNRCGFSVKRMHWYCPSCKNWNTVKPIHGVVGE